LAAGRLRGFGAAAADRRVVDHETAGAAAVHAGGDAIAAGLNHLAALLVAAGAGHHEAAVGHLAPTHAHREVARTAHHAVAHAAAATHAAGRSEEHTSELQSRGHLVCR